MPKSAPSKEKSAKSSTSYVTREWMYAGRLLNNEKLYYLWLDEEEEEKGYTKNLVSYAVIGGVYEVNVTPDGKSVAVGGKESPKFLHKLDNTDKILEFEMQDRTNFTLYNQLKAAKKASTYSELETILDPIARQYKKLPTRAAKTALMCNVIEILQRGGSL